MKTKIYLSSAFLCILFFTSCEVDEIQSQEEVAEDLQDAENSLSKASSWSVVFKDDFNSSGNINDQWTRTSGRQDYNSDLCHYKSWFSTLETLDNQQCLRLRAKKINNNEYRAGHVKSKFSYEPRNNEEYRLRARIKLISRDNNNYKGFSESYGAWPAFWTVQENGWPTKGEIDIMEGYSKGPSNTSFASNLFYGTQVGQNQLGSSAENHYTVSEGWHTYEMRWKKSSRGWTTVNVYLDGSLKKSYNNRINSNLKLQNFGPHNIILNMNVGHTPKDSRGNPVPGIFDNSRINLFSDTSMYVNWVQLDKRTL